MALGIQKLQGLHHKLSKVPYNFDFHHNHMVYMVIYNDARIRAKIEHGDGITADNGELRVLMLPDFNSMQFK